MADTGSEPKPKRGRLTLRLRLTLLYGICFLVAGAAVLGITYAVVAHDISSHARVLEVRGGDVGLSRTGTDTASSTTATSSGTTTTASSKASKTGTKTSNSKTSTTAASSGPVRRYHVANGGTGTATLAPATVVGVKGKLTSGQRVKLKRLRAEVQAKLIGAAATANLALQMQRDQSLSTLLTWSGSALGALALISILLGWFLAGRALKPLAAMTAKAHQITEQNLHERLAVNVREDELGQLANTFDGLLARLEHAFESQKRFVANASHELRTPLTLERTLAEVALADPAPSVESLRRVCERVVASTAQQEQLIEALLMLARSQNAIDASERINLAELVDAAIRQRTEQLRQITVTQDLEAAETRGNSALLGRLVANLLDNAIAHNGTDSPWIRLATGLSTVQGAEDDRGDDGRQMAWVRVSNSGEVISPGALDSLFEPFRRLQADRISNDGGFGLGLSIVQSIVTAHHGELQVTPLPEGGLCVEVRFAQTEGIPAP